MSTAIGMGTIPVKAKFEPSEYQQAIFDWVESRDGNNLIIEACAGSGKTTTGIKIFDLLDESVDSAFVAFNSHIAAELRSRLPEGANARTYHSLGFATLKKTYPKITTNPAKVEAYLTKKLSQNERWLKWSVLKLTSILKGHANYSPSFEALERTAFQYDIDTYKEKGDEWEDKIFDITKSALDYSVSNLAECDFDDQIGLPNVLPNISFFQHEFLFVDEVQDTNYAQMQLALHSIADGGSIVGVGDRKQCVIDSTKVSGYTKEDLEKSDFSGEVKLMSVVNVKPGDYLLSGYGNGKTRPSKVLKVYKNLLRNRKVIKVTTLSGKILTSTPDHVYFAGFNVNTIREKHYTYLMEKEGKFRIGKAKGYRSIQGKETLGFRGRGNQELADKMWILSISDSDTDARYWEAFYSFNYGIPLWLFRTVGRGYRLSYGEPEIKRLYESIDTKERAERLLKDIGYDINYPHYVPKSMSKRERRNFTVILCGDQRSFWYPMHRYSVSGSEDKDRQIIEKLGYKTRPAKNGKGWRLESAVPDLNYVQEMYTTLSEKMPINLIEKAHLTTGESLSFFPASNLLVGMDVFIVNDDNEVVKDTISKIETEMYSGWVYDFDIDRVHNFEAGGIITHNSIYAFRGADETAMDKLRNALEADELPLSISYRCPKAVQKLVNTEFPEIKFEVPEWAKEGKVGTTKRDGIEALLKPEDLILCRVNADLVPLAFSLLRSGVKAIIRGRDIGKGLSALIKKSHATRTEELYDWLGSWKDEEIQRAYRLHAEDKIQMINDKFETLLAIGEGCKTVDEVAHNCEILFSDDNAGVVLSTCHRAKGIEANNVFILRPDLMPHPAAKTEVAKAQENNIRYIAMTRCKESLTYIY